MPVGRAIGELVAATSSAWSRSKSGGGVAGRSTPASGRRTPTASPANSSPLSESCSARWCLAWPGESTVVSVRLASIGDRLAVLEHVDALGRRRVEPAVERVEQVAVDHRRAVDEPRRIDEVAGALLVHVHGRVRERPRHVADAAGVVEVDVRDRDAGEVVGRDVELGQRGEQRGDRRLAAGLDQHRLAALDQVAGRDVLPAAEQRVDLDDAGADLGVHRPTLPLRLARECRSALFARNRR